MNKENLIDSRNKDLYNKVREKYKVNLKRNDEDKWNSYVENGVVIISYSPTKYPISAFTHELLHIDTQLKGFKKIYRGVALNKEVHKHLPRIGECLDNELQHHKMFDKYISLGFPSNEFYNDSDIKTIEHLQEVLAIPQKSFISLSVDYMTLIAPGGIMSENKREEYKNAFFAYNKGCFRDRFFRIDNIISNWKSDTSYEAEKYMIQFFQLIEAGKTWISYSKEKDTSSLLKAFPEKGFYTEDCFTLEEL